MFKVEFRPNEEKHLEFCNIILREDGTFEYFITPRLSVEFFDLALISNDDILYKDLMSLIIELKLFENAKSILRTKFHLFEEYEEDRVNRFFAKQSKSIFFDSEQCFRLEEFLASTSINMNAEILYEGKPTEIKKLKLTDKAKIVSFLDNLDAIYEMTPREYLSYSNIRRYKKLVKRTEFEKGGAVTLTKKQLIGKVIGGGLLLAVGGIVATTGIMTASKSLSVLMGVNKEVILVEDEQD
jgi:hypothetical protein